MFFDHRVQSCNMPNFIQHDIFCIWKKKLGEAFKIIESFTENYFFDVIFISAQNGFAIKEKLR
jgi:hypothetical protein